MARKTLHNALTAAPPRQERRTNTRLRQLIDDIHRKLQMQMTRLGQLQAEVDLLKAQKR